MSDEEVPLTTASYVAISDELEPRPARTVALKICGIASLAVSLCVLIAVSFTGPDNALLLYVNSPTKQTTNSLNADEQSWQILKCVPTAVQGRYF